MGMVRGFAREMRSADLSGFLDPSRIPTNSEIGGWSFAGTRVNDRSALQLMTVWTCVSLISDTISTLPVGVFRKNGETREPVAAPPLIVKPHSEYDIQRWIAELLVSLLLRGNAYGWIMDRDPLGFARQIMPLHPDEVLVERVEGRIKYRVSQAYGQGSDPVTGAGASMLLDAADVLHIRGLSFPGVRNLTGLSPVDYARHAMGLGLAAQEFGSRWFSEGIHPAAVLETDQKITDETVARKILARFIRSRGRGARTPAILTNGLKYKPISITPEESQFLETRKFSRSEIAGFYHVPPHMAGDIEKSTSWGTGIEEQNLGFITYGLQPWIVRLENALSALLPRPKYVKLNIAGLLRGRLLDRFGAYKIAREGGWLNVDEIRALEDMAALSEGRGQDYLQPLNYAPVPPGGMPSPGQVTPTDTGVTGLAP